MIDLHFHCLPGIDDGPRDWDESVRLCRAAAEEGTDTLVATPHVLRDGWINDDSLVRDQLILRLNTLLGGRPSVLAGCEYAFSGDVLELLERGSTGPLTRINRGRYLLVEFAPGEMPAGTERLFHELSFLDVVPVIVHPERNSLFTDDPERLADLVRRGARVQITAGSLLGDFGYGPLDACEEFFERGLVHLVASDAHSLERRPPRLAPARRRVGMEWGKDAEVGIFESNPEAALRSEPLPWPSAPVSSEGETS